MPLTQINYYPQSDAPAPHVHCNLSSLSTQKMWKGNTTRYATMLPDSVDYLSQLLMRQLTMQCSASQCLYCDWFSFMNYSSRLLNSMVMCLE